MSKRKKGVSLDEKRERILKIYHESLDVFNLKEIEKLGSKAGVVLQTIKDVNQALVDDNLVDTDKIGSGNYFWSFPSKVAQQRKRKLEDIEERRTQLTAKLEQTNAAIEKQRALQPESQDRVDRLNKLAVLKREVDEAKKRIHLLKDNDPDLLNQLDTKAKIAKEGADRWTGFKTTFILPDNYLDNVFNLKSWVIKKNSCSSAEVEKWLGIPDDFDYIE
ncbi:meiotic nuclear division protein [Thraustotheca clavata]|uniref:Meiotic nuclear division protein n=1 Tax=Thraustotheca clavata TaxID=74557 RepID=A0A1V9YS52_9STRA|nr:meiotic nuclear division protein [Thraustotheca clavata]